MRYLLGILSFLVLQGEICIGKEDDKISLNSEIRIENRTVINNTVPSVETFVGRMEIIEEISKKINKKKEVYVTGIGGIGRIQRDGCTVAAGRGESWGLAWWPCRVCSSASRGHHLMYAILHLRTIVSFSVAQQQTWLPP